MQSGKDNRRLLLFIALGLLVHLPLLFWQWRPVVGESSVITVKLVPPQVSEVVDEPLAPEPPQVIEPIEPEPQPPVEQPPVEAASTPAAADQTADTPTPPLSPQQLREQIRVLAVEPADEDSANENLIQRKYTAFVPNALPALPSDPGDGELGGYMMLDEEIVTHFKDVNGWDRAEVTLRDGTIMCGERSRNQFMPDSILDSTNIFTWKVCRKGFRGGR
ncbi:MAG: hypothetical protein DHS20C11_13600 [Lysobacteraceae bacterium]|nr:MAG: hypothetical protein DHS20C11_13600 [Xanthomonadaceae bacterium]